MVACQEHRAKLVCEDFFETPLWITSIKKPNGFLKVCWVNDGLLMNPNEFLKKAHLIFKVFLN